MQEDWKLPRTIPYPAGFLQASDDQSEGVAVEREATEASSPPR